MAAPKRRRQERAIGGSSPDRQPLAGAALLIRRAAARQSKGGHLPAKEVFQMGVRLPEASSKTAMPCKCSWGNWHMQPPPKLSKSGSVPISRIGFE